MDAAVAQRADEASPVVRTSLRVPGGQLVHRCGGAQVSAGEWTGAGVLVEVSNDSAVPVAVALVLRPYRLDGTGRIDSLQAVPTPEGLDLAGSGNDGFVLRVDGTDAVLFDRIPARFAVGGTESVHRDLRAGSDTAVDPPELRRLQYSPDVTAAEQLEAAFVFPLPHGCSLSAALVSHEARSGARGGFGRTRRSEPTLPLRLPDLDPVVRGWARHCAEDPSLQWVIDAASEFVAWSAGMIRVAAPDAVTRSLDPAALEENASAAPRLGIICRALGSLPPSELHLAVAAALIRAQRFSGRVEPRRGQDATASLVWVASALLRGADRTRHADELVGPVAKALDWLGRAAPERDPVGTGPPDRVAQDEALLQVAVGLFAVGQPELAERALAAGRRLFGSRSPVEASGGLPATGSELPPEVSGDAMAHQLVFEVPAAMPGSRHADLGDTASKRSGRGFDVVHLAELRNRLLSSVVADTPRGPALFGLWSEDWNGRQVEIHRMPTAWGRVSAALRWHDDKAALLWDVQPWVGETDGATAPVVTAPALCPGWYGTGWTGEALLER